MEMKITTNFDSNEFAQKSRGAIPAKEYPQEWITDRLTPLCQQLEIIRTALGSRPITVISGYRSPAYNASIGGAKQSQHMEGRAADITVAGLSAAEVHAKILDLYNTKQLKIGGLGEYPGFVHVDIRPTPRLVRWSGSRQDS